VPFLFAPLEGANPPFRPANLGPNDGYVPTAGAARRARSLGALFAATILGDGRPAGAPGQNSPRQPFPVDEFGPRFRSKRMICEND